MPAGCLLIPHVRHIAVEYPIIRNRYYLRGYRVSRNIITCDDLYDEKILPPLIRLDYAYPYSQLFQYFRTS